MGYPTPIEWTDATWNPIGGCSIKSPGCKPCYAQDLAGTRLKNHPLYAGTTTTVKGKPVFNGHLTVAPDDHPTWKWPIGWRGAKAPKLGAGQPSLIFVGDMSDLFHEDRPRDVQNRVIASIIYTRHIGQLLTKRPGVMADYFADLSTSWRWLTFRHPQTDIPSFNLNRATFENAIIPRLWLGMSAERQREFDERWPHLRRLAAMGFIVFVSYEPAIGPLVLPPDFLALGARAQVISGGMSGDEATPSRPVWFRAVRDQCAAAGVAYFHKQWGEFAPREIAIQVYGADYDAENEVEMARVGKKLAGRLLDGVEHNGFPR